MFDFLSDAWDKVGDITPDWVKTGAKIAFPVVAFGTDWAAGALGLGDDKVPPLEQIPAPPPPPDLADEAVRQARLGARRRALMGTGLDSTFLSGPLGDLSSPTIRTPGAGGY